jgi:hypothetical protein
MRIEMAPISMQLRKGIDIECAVGHYFNSQRFPDRAMEGRNYMDAQVGNFADTWRDPQSETTIDRTYFQREFSTPGSWMRQIVGVSYPGRLIRAVCK